MNREHRDALVTRFPEAWTSQDVERVLDCYTDDLRYRDPNTRGEVTGRESLRRYLTRLFTGWQMTWEARDVFDLAGQDGVALLWQLKGIDMRTALKGIVAAAVLAFAVPAPAASPADQKAELRKMCDEALATLYKAKPEARKLVETSPGYGCFSSFGLAFFVGGSGGRGLVVNNKTKKTVYMKMGAASGGLDFGAKGYREVLVFKNEPTLNQFVTSGWEFGGRGSAVAAAGDKGIKGQAAEISSSAIQVFPMTKTGLEAGISAETRKYWKDYN